MLNARKENCSTLNDALQFKIEKVGAALRIQATQYMLANFNWEEFAVDPRWMKLRKLAHRPPRPSSFRRRCSNDLFGGSVILVYNLLLF